METLLAEIQFNSATREWELVVGEKVLHTITQADVQEIECEDSKEYFAAASALFELFSISMAKKLVAVIIAEES